MIQYGDDPRKSPIFYQYLDKLIRDLKISLIAEEVNTYNFQNPDHRMIVKELAVKHSLEYIMCEPEIDERSKYGLEELEKIVEYFNIVNSYRFTNEEKEPYIKLIDDHNDKRENIWYERIKNKTDKIVLLVVGKDHVSQYSPRKRGIDTVFKENNLEYKVLDIFI